MAACFPDMLLFSLSPWNQKSQGIPGELHRGIGRVSISHVHLHMRIAASVDESGFFLLPIPIYDERADLS